MKNPEIEEKPVKYIRKPIDYSILDDVGHGVKLEGQSSNQQKSSSSYSLKDLPENIETPNISSFNVSSSVMNAADVKLGSIHC